MQEIRIEKRRLKYIGPFVKHLREYEAGLTQTQLADAIGFSEQTISAIENAKKGYACISVRTIVEFLKNELGYTDAEFLSMFNMYCDNFEREHPELKQ